MSFLQTSSRATPNLTFSSRLGYGPEGCPQDVTTLLKVAARLCILAAQLLMTDGRYTAAPSPVASNHPTITLTLLSKKTSVKLHSTGTYCFNSNMQPARSLPIRHWTIINMLYIVIFNKYLKPHLPVSQKKINGHNHI